MPPLLPLIIIITAPPRVERSLNLFYSSSISFYKYIYIHIYIYIYIIFIVLTFIIHLTVVETSSFSVDFYRKIFKEIL